MKKTQGDVVNCFDSKCFEKILNPTYQEKRIDMFMARVSDLAIKVVSQLALDAGFGSCMDFGKSDKVELLEKFALRWINLAIMQGRGRDFSLVITPK